MYKQDKTLILLKYQIITPDIETWHLCETYPIECLKRWTRKIVKETEHFVKGYRLLENFVQAAKDFDNGKITIDHLDLAWGSVSSTTNAKAFYTALAFYTSVHPCYNFARNKPHTAYYSVMCHVDSDKSSESWKQYIEWLVEELYEYESTHAIDLPI